MNTQLTTFAVLSIFNDQNLDGPDYFLERETQTYMYVRAREKYNKNQLIKQKKLSCFSCKKAEKRMHNTEIYSVARWCVHHLNHYNTCSGKKRPGTMRFRTVLPVIL